MRNLSLGIGDKNKNAKKKAIFAQTKSNLNLVKKKYRGRYKKRTRSVCVVIFLTAIESVKGVEPSVRRSHGVLTVSQMPSEARQETQ